MDPEKIIARLAQLGLLLFVGFILAASTALVVERMASVPNAADWAQAVGGLLAVFAVSVVAMAESRRARRQAQLQTELQTAAARHQVDLQERSIAAAIEASNVASALRRDAAHAAISAALVILTHVVEMLNKDKAPTQSFADAWRTNYDAAILILRNIPYHDLQSSKAIKEHALILIFVDDFWDAVTNACTRTNKNSQLLYRHIAKTKLNLCFNGLERLDAALAHKEDRAHLISTAEEKATWADASKVADDMLANSELKWAAEPKAAP